MAHHTRLVYESRPDVNTEFTRGWKVTKSLRLSHVDVTSVKDAGGGRVLLRRYHLDYAASTTTACLRHCKSKADVAT